MRVEEGRSFEADGHAAVAEATSGWPSNPQIVFAFCSATQDASEVAKALRERFGDAPIAGCTTAGEHSTPGHSNGSVVVAAIYDSSMTWSVELVRDLGGFDATRAEEATARLFAAVGADRETLEPGDFLGLHFIDGLSMAEEKVTGLLAEAFEGVPLAGGSAGDDLAFRETRVISGEGAFSDAMVIALAARGSADVRVVKHQHFNRTPTMLCITKADPATRTVHEMDGYPAQEAYARALGLSTAQAEEASFLNPVTFACNGELYVRSIQKFNDDGSITFYCAIEEGMVLDVASHAEMPERLAVDLDSVRADLGAADFVLAFNCILRALEAKQKEEFPRLDDAMRSGCGTFVGFDTYGEQLNGLHINQTLVAVAIRESA